MSDTGLEQAPSSAPSTPKSSRVRTRENGVFIRDTPGSQSLSRGLLLLRAFRTGITAVSNAEFAAFSGLPKSTVSRLTRTLVDAGYLEYHIASGTYRLGPPLLTLGAGARRSSGVLPLALPQMRVLAERWSLNVGLAVEDFGEMVYLDSVRRNRMGQFRRAPSGHRLPVAETALGRAWLAGLTPERREQALGQLAARYAERWSVLQPALQGAIDDVQRQGWCEASFRQGELVSMAMPLVLSGVRVHALNISYPASQAGQRDTYAEELLGLGRRVVEQFNGGRVVPLADDPCD